MSIQSNVPLFKEMYHDQIANMISQFMSAFDGMTVDTGKRADGNIVTLPVPIIYGSRDRVSASILAKHANVTPVAVPVMSAYMSGIQYAADRAKGTYDHRSESRMRRGDDYEDPVTYSTNQMQPVPYALTMEVNIWVSNTLQMLQILEPLLITFGPDIEVTLTSTDGDAAHSTMIKLTDVSLDENYALGTDSRLITFKLQFEMIAYLTVPIVQRDNIIHKINVNMQTGSKYREMVTNAFNEESLGTFQASSNIPMNFGNDKGTP